MNLSKSIKMYSIIFILKQHTDQQANKQTQKPSHHRTHPQVNYTDHILYKSYSRQQTNTLHNNSLPWTDAQTHSQLSLSIPSKHQTLTLYPNKRKRTRHFPIWQTVVVGVCALPYPVHKRHHTLPLTICFIYLYFFFLYLFFVSSLRYICVEILFFYLNSFWKVCCQISQKVYVFSKFAKQQYSTHVIDLYINNW